MRRRTMPIVPVAAALLALASAVATAADAPVPAATTKAPAAGKRPLRPDRAKEVVVLVTADAEGNVVTTPETAYVGSGQKVVLVTCCETVNAKFPKPIARIPGFHCERNECTIVAPAVTKPTTAEYVVQLTCGGKTFGKDPVLIFIP